LRTADEEQVDSMVKQALTVAAEEISEKYAHTSCVHNANIYPPSSVATDEGTARGTTVLADLLFKCRVHH